MPPTEPLVVHEEERKLESSNLEITGPVCWGTLLSADRTPIAEIVLGVAEVEPGKSAEFRQHSHDHAEVYHILLGYGVVTISNDDYLVRPGTTIFLSQVYLSK